MGGVNIPLDMVNHGAAAIPREVIPRIVERTELDPFQDRESDLSQKRPAVLVLQRQAHLDFSVFGQAYGYRRPKIRFLVLVLEIDQNAIVHGLPVHHFPLVRSDPVLGVLDREYRGLIQRDLTEYRRPKLSPCQAVLKADFRGN